MLHSGLASLLKFIVYVAKYGDVCTEKGLWGKDGELSYFHMDVNIFYVLRVTRFSNSSVKLKKLQSGP